MDKYTIYLVNTGASTQLFWCFLERPEELASDPAVFANSSAFLQVKPNYPGLNRFVIPVQYVVGAGANNQAVGLNVLVSSDITQNANLTDMWDAAYYNAPPPQGPDLTIDNAKVGANQVGIKSNNFNQVQNEAAHWFANQSFGIVTDAGFMGMTWSPNPGQTRKLTPKLTFYVAIGAFGANSLAAWTTISNDSEAVQVPNDFKYNECTVTYDASGNWSKTPGKPSTMLLAAEETKAMAVLDKRRLAGGQFDTVKSVHWESGPAADIDFTYLTGTISITRALTSAFAFFVLSGLTFTIDSVDQGGTTVHFSYSGPDAADRVKHLLKAGAQVLFG